MPLPWSEIRDKAITFSREWQDAESERAEAQTFWNEFFAVFGVPRRRVASFEEPVKKLGAKRGRIDAFWKGQLVVEHKSRGQDLDRAFVQALDYFPGIPDRDAEVARISGKNVVRFFGSDTRAFCPVSRRRRKSDESEKVPEISPLRCPVQPLAEATKNVFNECVATHS